MSKKPNDADRIAGLTSILQTGNKSAARPAPPPSPAPLPATTATAAEPTARSQKPKKMGKYRDPDFHHYGVYLRKASHKQAMRRLEDTESGMDMSDLLQSLLEQWLASD